MDTDMGMELIFIIIAELTLTMIVEHIFTIIGATTIEDTTLTIIEEIAEDIILIIIVINSWNIFIRKCPYLNFLQNRDHNFIQNNIHKCQNICLNGLLNSLHDNLSNSPLIRLMNI